MKDQTSYTTPTDLTRLVARCEHRLRRPEMELAIWSGWTVLLLWYLNALRGDIRGPSR